MGKRLSMLEIRRAISTYHIIWNPNPYSRHKAEERALISSLMSNEGSFEYQWRHAEDKIMSFDATQHASLRETSRWTVTRERVLSWWLSAKQLAYYALRSRLKSWLFGAQYELNQFPC